MYTYSNDVSNQLGSGSHFGLMNNSDRRRDIPSSSALQTGYFRSHSSIDLCISSPLVLFDYFDLLVSQFNPD